jgi:hypothetical protein
MSFETTTIAGRASLLACVSIALAKAIAQTIFGVIAIAKGAAQNIFQA